ncbi:FtsB family cell division protein [Paenibacillus protaetiae]|uniref:Septum formation initiator family protein n=1 Tax=Paenibacillus protaetiae TaxID=2509456 RepID=A0A4P6EXF5_9BACL|nr:septum formation initiator family protein [Paenibacillus protaetiae]QAY67436.1 septum formation initiator family protein [Paenibacillus protaetiae]
MAIVAATNSNKPAARPGSKRRMKIWLAFMVIFMGWAAYTFFGQMQQQQETASRYATMKQQRDEAIQQKQSLSEQIDKLNDPEYIEQLATKEQGMVKEGEKVIQVVK